MKKIEVMAVDCRLWAVAGNKSAPRSVRPELVEGLRQSECFDGLGTNGYQTQHVPTHSPQPTAYGL
jgi:hypothetical protein